LQADYKPHAQVERGFRRRKNNDSALFMGVFRQFCLKKRMNIA
jgi:hypothetical protein